MLQVIILTALCAVFATVFLRAEMHNKYVSADVWKGFASLCFVLIGLLNSPGSNVATLLIYGLILGFIADIFCLLYLYQAVGYLPGSFSSAWILWICSQASASISFPAKYLLRSSSVISSLYVAQTHVQNPSKLIYIIIP